MPYFPSSIMPLTPKQNATGIFPVGNAITASEFNLLDEELQAIQTYLLGQGTVLPDFSKRVKNLTLETNQVALRQSVSNVVSGYCISGMRVRLPETSCTWLTKLPEPTDKEITVNSTNGFPSTGVISIINDVDQIQKGEDITWIRNSESGVTTVEWIKYNGKTSDTFLDCERGYMSTYPSTHSGYYTGNANATDIVNLRDHCPVIPLKTMKKICQRRINRPYVSNYFPLFGYNGTTEDMMRRLMFDGASFKFYPDNPYLEGMRKAFSAVEASAEGVLSYGIWREQWSYNSQNVLALEYAFLQSEDYSYSLQGMLTGLEAYAFINTALQYGNIFTSSMVQINWPENGIPVFNGRLDLSVGFAEWTYNNMPEGSDYMSPEAPRIVIYADGTVAGYLDKFGTFSDVAQSVIGYSAKMISGY